MFLMERKEGHLLKGSEQPVSALDLPGVGGEGRAGGEGRVPLLSGLYNCPDSQGPAVCEMLRQVLWALGVSLTPSDLVWSPDLSPGGEKCGQRVMPPALSNAWLLGRTSWK